MKNNRKIIFLAIFILIIILYSLLYFLVYIKTPFPMDGDIFFHLGNIEHMKDSGIIQKNLYYNTSHQDWYGYFPLFHILISICSFITGIGSINILFLFSIFIISLIILGFYILFKESLGNLIYIILGIVFLIPVGNSGNFGGGYTPFHFFYLSPSSIDIFLILILIGFLIKYLKNDSKDKLMLTFIGLLTLSIFFYHIESVFRIVVNLFICFFIIGLLEKGKRNYLFKISLILIICLIVLFVTNYGMFLNSFDLSGRINQIFSPKGEPSNLIKYNIIDYYGTLIVLFFILGIIFYFKNLNKDNPNLPLSIIIIFLLTNLIFGQEYLFKLNIFPDRFLQLSIYFVVLFIIVFLLTYLKNIKILNSVLILYIFLILIIIFIPFFVKLSNVNLGSNWDYIDDLDNLKTTLDEGKAVSDYWTLFKITGYIPQINPSYNFSRPGLLKIFYNSQQNETDIQGVFYNSKKDSYNYMISNNIQYIIIDNEATPIRIPVDYKKFNDSNFYINIYKSKFFTIYKVNITNER